MKAIRFHEFGDVDVLRYEDAPIPVLESGDVLIRLKAASVNHLDIFVRRGIRVRRMSLPHIPGSDGAGIIAQIGPSVDAIHVGERVLISSGMSCGSCNMCVTGRENLCREYHLLGTLENGTYAEFVRVPAENVLPIPEGLDFAEAAAIPLVFLTAWHMLVTLAKIQEGETVLIHGAGSGVGSAGIQLAKYFGARVIVVASSDEKLEKAKLLGSDEVINYRVDDFAERVNQITNRRGVDIVLEHIGGKILEKCIPILGRGGRLVTCGATIDFLATIDLRYLYSRHQSLLGSWVGTRMELLHVLRLFEGNPATRKLHPVIDRILPLHEASEAHGWMESRKNFGKIVLTL